MSKVSEIITFISFISILFMCCLCSLCFMCMCALSYVATLLIIETNVKLSGYQVIRLSQNVLLL